MRILKRKQERSLQHKSIQELAGSYWEVQEMTENLNAERARGEAVEELEQKVKERTMQLSASNDLLKKEVLIRKRMGLRLAQRNKDITDSIVYAKRIQKAILDKPEGIKAMFPESFILNKPKDIVSGDFFWYHSDGNKKMVVVADCTGHGVPGALMSIIGNDILNQIVREFGILDPAQLLQLLDRRLNAALNREGHEVNDGMDVCACVIDDESVCYAGACRPLFHLSGTGMAEIRGSARTIGGSPCETEKDFFTECFPRVKGDMIYLTSDGYYSQFGGPADKKFMKGRFKKTLNGLGTISMEDQAESLEAIFTEWSNDSTQIDDVLVIGIRL